MMSDRSPKLFISAFWLIVSGLLWVFIGVGALVSISLQGQLLERHTAIAKTRWFSFVFLGIMAGLASALLFTGELPKPRSELITVGWGAYFAKAFSILGIVVGLAGWLALRQKIRHIGWVVPAIAFGGFCAGAFQGTFTDDYILALGMTSNNLGERIGGASIGAVPVAQMIFGVVMSSILAVVLVQHSWQVRGTSAGSQNVSK